ncbi:GNAT family N-acetyltransferase [Ichthyenterobacterium sp. W332]|uniref:GNAT family N-acetyltransferase n=1 Tax=Microcosmobacter mediterraneus TaxID=3075607 RepID=A0ABU2YKQ7_9FLAO|nr:GNAT family N-acetyltransferase [Ichthyenterobacterium sp. W332]MDT0558739.1 GNAT family N-acetyltransferase [Ichthyenterobacterium sp. W332]
MEKDSKGVVNRIKWIYKLIRHGLFWQGVRNNLAKIGVDIMPYYYFIAVKENAEPQAIRDKNLEVILTRFNEEDMNLIKSSIIGIEQKDFLSDLKDGDICIGLKYNEEIVGYTLIKRKPFYFRKRYFHLGKEDIYLHSLYVFDKYRGKNIAPYMKYKRFEMFEKEGVKYHHAIVESFNKSALKIQYKAAAKKAALYLSIILFKRWTFNYTLKKY